MGILADLQGPKIRLGVFAGGSAALRFGARFTLTTRDVVGNAALCSTTYRGLPGDVSPSDLLLLDDGRLAVRVIEVAGTEVVTEVVEGGVVSDHKGLNLPGVAVSVPAMSDKDVEDLRWALRAGVDLVALSFVRSAADFADVRKIMDEEGLRLPVLAKVEKPQAVENLDEIVEAFDGIMVARGDLGVELPIEQVPLVQKRAIRACRAAGKPVIVATQILDSMVAARRPTRAEASDVANAVIDGADALMLSAETSIGAHPALVVETMARIVRHIEDQIQGTYPPPPDDEHGGGTRASTARALTAAACEVGAAVDATHLIAFTETGRSARLVSRHRPPVSLLAFTPSQRVRSQLALVWGVETFLISDVKTTDQMVELVDSELLRLRRCSVGDRVVLIAGVPPGVAGTTNGMRVHVMGALEHDGAGR